MNILVVDNDIVFLRFMEKFLEADGHRVETAIDGLSALGLLDVFIPEILFVDYVMPNIDGKAFCQIVKSNPLFESAFVVLLSAVAAEEWTDLRKIGADACIAKGPLNKMKAHIQDVLQDPDSARSYCKAGNIIGLEDVFPRLITKELLASKKHFQLLLERMSEGILQLNPEYKIVFANPAAQNFFRQSANAILGAPFLELFPDNQKKTARALLESRNQSPESKPPDNLIVVHNQFFTLKIIRLNNGERNSLVIINDISAHKLIEKELRDTNGFLRNILNSSCSISIISTDLEQNILFWNKGAENLFGYTADEVVRKQKINILYPGPQEKKWADNLRQKLRQDKQEISCKLTEISKNGQSLYMNLHLSPRLDPHGNVVGILGIGEDITKRQQTEDALRESREKYRIVLEASQDPIVVYDTDDQVQYFNPAFTRVFGWSLEERLGKRMDDFVPGDTLADTRDMIAKVMRGETVSNFETIRYNRARQPIHVSISAAIYRDSLGNITGSVINLRDIRERKKLEGQLRQAQKMESLGTLAGGVAHDFNNLLMGIQGRASLMKMDTDTSHPHSEHLAGIEDYVQSAAALTKQLLGFARGGKYEVKATDLNELVKNQCHMFGRTRKDITIHTKYEASLSAAEVDEGQIEQVLLNIFVNAWQAMPGGGNLFIQTENDHVDTDKSAAFNVAPGNYSKVSVADTGTGMDAATRERIFDPFFTTKEIGRGTGLGLASAYGIIHNHGGFIDVHSEKGKGSTFYIYLPASDKKAIKEKRIRETILKGSETVLLVDDEDIIVDVGQDLLEILGYEVLVAKSGQEALELYRANFNRIDIVILDMVMPKMDGGEIYTRLKEINADIKALLSSGYSVNGQASDILKMGCNGFIQKPFSMGDLSKKIREILDD